MSIERGCAMPPSSDPFYAGLGQAVRIGTELLAALIVGGGLGWVDRYLPPRIRSLGYGRGVGFGCCGRCPERLSIGATVAGVHQSGPNR